MPWFKVDDQLAFHSKTMLAGNGAMGLWVRAGSWASATLTDGFIPAHMAHAMGEDDQIQQLLTAGMWDETDGGYVFHDWDEFQPSAEQEKRLRKERSEAGKAGARARWASKPDGKPDGKSHSNRHGKPMASAMANGWQTDAPSRPVPSPPSNEGGGVTSSPRPRAHRLPDGWTPTPELRTQMAQECPGVDQVTEHRKFTDYWRSQPDSKARKVDWAATWRNWIRRANENPNRQSASQRNVEAGRRLHERVTNQPPTLKEIF